MHTPPHARKLGHTAGPGRTRTHMRLHSHPRLRTLTHTGAHTLQYLLTSLTWWQREDTIRTYSEIHANKKCGQYSAIIDSDANTAQIMAQPTGSCDFMPSKMQIFTFRQWKFAIPCSSINTYFTFLILQHCNQKLHCMLTFSKTKHNTEIVRKGCLFLNFFLEELWLMCLFIPLLYATLNKTQRCEEITK